MQAGRALASRLRDTAHDSQWMLARADVVRGMQVIDEAIGKAKAFSSVVSTLMDLNVSAVELVKEPHRF